MAVDRTERQRVEKVLDDTVGPNGQDVQELPVIPDGEVWRVTRFGGSEVGSGDGRASAVTLQLFDGTTWQTLRTFGLSSAVAEVALSRDIRGDGKKKLRVVRQNGAGAPRRIVAWLDAFKVG